MSIAVSLGTSTWEKALDAVAKLPPFSPVLNKLMASLADEDVSFADLAALIERDTVLAGSVLRMVNSAFYARRGTVNSVRQAVSILGLAKLRNMSMSLSLTRMWNSAAMPPGWSAREFNLHSVGAALLADALAVELNADYAEGAFSAALLQNVGMMLIAIGMPEEQKAVRDLYTQGNRALPDCERELLGFDHAALSGETLRRWHLPEPIVDAATRHHASGHQPGQVELSWIVEMADLMVEQQGIKAQSWMRTPGGTPMETLSGTGLAERAPAILESFYGEYEALKSFFV